MCWAQSDVINLIGGHIEEGHTREFFFYFQNISETGIDTGTPNAPQGFFLAMNVLPGLVSGVSFEPSELTGPQVVLASQINTDLASGYLEFVMIVNPVEFQLDASFPGDPIASMVIDVAPGTDGQIIDFIAATNFSIQDSFGVIINSVGNGNLIADLEPITIGTHCLAAFRDYSWWPNQITIFELTDLCNAPKIAFFRANPELLLAGETATLRWDVTQADSVLLDPGAQSVAPVGSMDVSPLSTTEYTIHASNTFADRQASTMIVVGDPPPLVEVFEAMPPIIELGGSSILCWEVSNATNITLEPGFGAVSALGSVLIEPTTTTTYTITATNAVAVDQANTTVVVVSP